MQAVWREELTVVLLILFLFCGSTFSYRTYSALSSVVFTNIDRPEDDVHSEYYFGMCATRHRELILYRQYTYEELRGNLVVGEWVNITEEPSCIYIRAKSPYGDIVRYHPMKFSICICSIFYNYERKEFTYWYYEWYIPLEISEGISWDLFFYVTSHKKTADIASVSMDDPD